MSSQSSTVLAIVLALCALGFFGLARLAWRDRELYWAMNALTVWYVLFWAVIIAQLKGCK